MMPGIPPSPRLTAPNLERFIGYLVDALILVPVYFILFFVPIIGWIASGLIGAAWILLRDAKGLSIGKKIMSLEVISKTMTPASQDQLMKRNYTLAGALAISGIPLVGLIGTVIVFGECIYLLVKGERFGDEMAGTVVVKK